MVNCHHMATGSNMDFGKNADARRLRIALATANEGLTAQNSQIDTE